LFILIKDLTPIGNKIIITKDDKNVIVRKSTTDRSNGYELKAPLDYFNFTDVTDLAFYDFVEFYQYFKTFDNPEIYVGNNKIILKENDAKIEYGLLDKESINDDEMKTFPKKINFGETVYSFKFSSEDHNEMLNMISLLQNKEKIRYTNVNIKNKKITFSISNAEHCNSFEKSINLDVSKSDDELTYTIFSDIFVFMPCKKNYTFNITEEGILTKISLVSENISLDLFTSKIKD
jgi:hypothetical protein